MDFKYPYTDYHELNLDWFLSEFKNLVETWARTQQDWISMQEYIRDYFDNLNVQTEIDNKINAMIQDGTFGAIVEPFVTAALPAMVAGQLPDVVAAQIGAVVADQIDAVVAGQLPAVAAAAAAEEVGAWLAAHIDPDTGYVIDDTLTVSQAAADAKVTGDRLTVVESYVDHPVNLYNPVGTRLKKAVNNNGNLEDAMYAATSDFISLKAGTYCYLGSSDVYGNAARTVPCYDTDHNFTNLIYGTISNNIVTFTLTTDAVVRLKLAIASLDVAMLVAGSVYPDEYIKYSAYDCLSDTVKVKSENLEGLEDEIASIDFLNIDAVYKIKSITKNDYYMSYLGQQGTGGYCCYFTVHAGEKYKIKCIAGSAVVAYVIFNSEGDLSRYHTIESWGTTHDYDIEITIKDYEEGATLYVNSIDKLYLAVKENVYQIDPDNPLFGKIAVFDGDSICHGTSVGQSSPYYGYGWAGRIGDNNNMDWHNVGVSGGTITSGLYIGDTPRHWVSSYISTIHNNYPDADYIILEGGTNDADILNGQPDKIGTLDPYDYSGNYDNETYCGALDYLFYNALNYFPKAKIGFIVAPIMGTGRVQKQIRKSFFDIAIQACKKWSIPYINLWEEGDLCPDIPSQYTSGDPDNLYTDGQHLTDAGYDHINNKIESWMKTL